VLDAALKELFGHDGFRPGQREACQAALDGRDALVVMPTGAGKSLCYQLPALMGEQLAIVVSPLVSLMQDQVEALHARGHADRVALVNAQQSTADNTAILGRAVEGSLRLLYVAPERFHSPRFVEAVRRADIGLFVVDEAHCVSQWGHDFRPDYFRLADAARYVGARSILAATATATPRVAVDVAQRLRLREHVSVATGFDRPNLSFTVARPSPHEKRRMLSALLGADGALPAIVYAGTRAGTEDTAAELTSELGVEAVAYHAGLDRERRAAVQRRFLADEVPIIVATNAFGMGVDKPNVRTVVHVSVPSSLEAYYQEAGRAGRDGLASRAVLLAEGRDRALHVHFIKRDELPAELPQRLAAEIHQASGERGRYDCSPGDLARAVGCDGERLRAVIGHLARAGVIEPTPAAPDRIAGRLLGRFDGRAANACRTSMEEAARSRWRQYREVWAYVEGETCRRTQILRHFGDGAEPTRTGRCCDVCDVELRLTVPPPSRESVRSLEEAIARAVVSARPGVGRTACVEILHGARNKKVERHSWDGLPVYGAFSHMARAQILECVDSMLANGALATTGGRYPLLSVPAPAAAA